MYSKIKNILNGVNLLIVEDDESLRESIKISVESYVSEVYACANAKEALEVFEAKDVNLVLSDINMPHMNGLEMAARIRRLDKDVPIIFLTAYGSDENMLSAIELGSFGVLKKPFEKRDLIMQMSFAANKFKNDFAQVDLKNGFKFNAFSRQLTKDGRPVALTKKEQNLLHLFLKNQGRVVSFEMIETCVWQEGSCTADMVYKSRIKYPMVRKSYLENPDSPKPELRGKDGWVRVRYEDAIKLVARELKKTRKQKGLEGVFAGSYGWKSSGNVHNSRILLHRFMNLSGGFVGSLGDYSTGASQVIMPHVVGSIEVYEQQTSWPVVLENSKVVVIWGANPMATLRIAWTSTDEQGFKYFEELKKRSDIKVIIIDPIRSDTAQYFDKAEWIAPVPNTDTAMMLGMMHYLYESGKYDKNFIETYTSGFDKFLPYLLGKTDGTPKNLEWASKICGLKASLIKELADTFAANRTMIMSGWGMQRAHHGEQPHWAMVTLAAMLGQIGLPGGGFGLSYHYSNGGAPTCKGAVIGGVNSASVGKFNDEGEFIGTDSGEFDANGRFVAKAAAVAGTGQSWLQKATHYAFPVARIADALLNPGKVIDHNGKKITYPDIDFIYWVGGNPFAHHQETNRLLEAWRKPRTVVVNEAYWTPTAKMADIVFPTTTAYERNDVTMTGDYSNMNIVPMKQVVEKYGEARDDYQIFTDLCKAYAKNLVVAYTDNGKDEFDWIKEYYGAAYEQVKAIPDFETDMKPFEEFWNENKPVTFASTPESDTWVRFGEFREDPVLNPLGTPSGLIEIYSETIEKMGYDDCGAHPMWFEPIEWLGMKDKPAELHMLSPHPTDRLHSQLNQTSLRENYAIANREPIWIHPKDAAKKGIKTGDLVRVFNARGEVLAGALVTQDIKEGVVKLAEGVWYDGFDAGLCKNGSPNVLTIDIPTSKLANGNISHTALVNIEKFTGKAPELTAFSDPKFV